MRVGIYNKWSRKNIETARQDPSELPTEILVAIVLQLPRLQDYLALHRVNRKLYTICSTHIVRAQWLISHVPCDPNDLNVSNRWQVAVPLSSAKAMLDASSPARQADTLQSQTLLSTYYLQHLPFFVRNQTIVSQHPDVAALVRLMDQNYKQHIVFRPRSFKSTPFEEYWKRLAFGDAGPKSAWSDTKNRAIKEMERYIERCFQLSESDYWKDMSRVLAVPR
ncbi:hypothetical protein BZG36_00541 [Bifiguratus adelaidae]|uniref:F-box domain-containing protein n=1 Tax=Bifiguratus adelaidae TaxID=1938954 RepID=A0A261Y719_9FUNG|nr:hypothetical protein BZG36_00541 [Bifiguratus adelaidae]